MEQENNVWGSLVGAAGDVLNIRDRVRTTSSPSGASDTRVYNPFPGTQGAYPQAEAKASPAGETEFSIPRWLWLAVAALAVYIVFRR